MIEPVREFDAARLNAVLNDPLVRPDVAQAEEGPIDMSKLVANTDNVLLMGEHGGCFFLKLMAGVYEVHTQALREGRGRWIYEMTRACGVYMFTRTDAFEITTRIPVKHNAARHLAIAAGMRHEFTRPMECVWRGESQNVDIYSYRVQDWAADCGELDASGFEFHEFLHHEAQRLGVTSRPHEDDPQHNRVVGIALAMAEHGNAVKGVVLYNRWALLSRHPIIHLISTDPVRVRFDIGDLVIENGTRRVEGVQLAA